MKEWLNEIVIDTIVAVVVTLLLYVVGADQTWDDAARTFIMSFLIMFVLGVFKKMKQNK